MVSQRLEDLLVTVSERNANGDGFPIAVGDRGFSPPVMYEFLRTFPLSAEGLSKVMRLALRDLKSSYNNGYQIHGLTWVLHWDRVQDKFLAIKE